ncbi:12583_t:CDS:2 [Gigaspora margarita]|uniref:12583_t:CDS:1 n=1 Tax=Gigaspora margarita TaxID=4874 RepID=A0ABN7V7K7_GIGMA|nr:12583_t:CDS:2 [Gigaspora margarita]
MSIAQYRDVDQDLSDAKDNASDDDSASLNQSKQEMQITSCESGLSENCNSPVWPCFNKKTEGKLARNLNIHNIVVLKQEKKLLNSNPYPKIEQQEQTDLVVRWIICDLQPFRVVEREEW